MHPPHCSCWRGARGPACGNIDAHGCGPCVLPAALTIGVQACKHTAAGLPCVRVLSCTARGAPCITLFCPTLDCRASTLAEFGTHQLEFWRLSQRTGNATYAQLAEATIRHLNKLAPNQVGQAGDTTNWWMCNSHR